jgi:hypothetical protein
MWRKLCAIAVALTLAIGGLSESATAAPTVAHTTTVTVVAVSNPHPQLAATHARLATLWHNCPSDVICLYQWTGYGAPAGDANPGWKSSFHNLLSQHCINLTSPAAYWPNGTPVWDNSAALIVGGSGAYGTGDSISFYNSLNCNSNTGVTSVNANWVTGYSDLHDVPMGFGYTAYHTIASIGWVGDQCPPPGC